MQLVEREKNRLFLQKGVQQLEVQVDSRSGVKPTLVRDIQRRKIHVGSSHFPLKPLFLDASFGLYCDPFLAPSCIFSAETNG